MDPPGANDPAVPKPVNTGKTLGEGAMPILRRMASGAMKPAQPLVRLQTMERLLRQFRHMAGKAGYLCEKDFKKAADIRSDFFASRLFHSIDQDGDGAITCDEFVYFMHTLECQDVHGRLRILFDMYDIDGTGRLNLSELIQLLVASVEESNSHMEMKLVEQLASCIVESFDVDGDGEISFEEFVKAISEYPELLVGLTVVGLGSDSLKKGLGLRRKCRNRICQPINTVINNPQRTLWIVLLVAGLCAAFWWRFSRYSSGPKHDLMTWTLPLAKGCGQVVKVTTTLILLPVSRTTMTWLRETPLRHVVPFDDAIAFHILLGTLGFVFAWIHTLAHVNDILRWGDPKSLHLYHKAFPDEAKQPTYYELCTSLIAITGIVQLVSYTLVFITASNWPRRAPWMVNTRLGRWLNDFKLIWRVHHLTLVYMGALLFHPFPHIPDEANEWGYSDVWAWVGIPVLIYTLERIARVYRQTRDVRILSAELLPGKVLALKLSKPKGFECDSGMYVYINCPSISTFEWHPFSLTSAPGAANLMLHIRVAGDWTEELYYRFQAYERTQRHEEFELAYMKHVIPTLETMARSSHVVAVPVPATVPSDSSHSSGSPDAPWTGLPLVKDCTKAEVKPSTPLTSARSGLLEPLMRSGAADKMSRQLSAPSSVTFVCPGSQNQHLHPGQADPSAVIIPVSINPLWDTESDGSDLSARGVPGAAWQSSSITDEMNHAPGLPIEITLGTPRLGASDGHSSEQRPTPFASMNASTEAKCDNPEVSTGGDPDVQKEDATPSKSVKPQTPVATTVAAKDPPHARGAGFGGDIHLPLKLLLDGPFGAPVRGYKDYSVLLLVGAGIGVTPFASILSDLVHRMRESTRTGKQGPFPFKKVYFYWSVRSQSEVVWFSQVLESISREDVHKLLEINVHITGLRSANDVRTMPLKLVQVAVHKRTGMDVMSGLSSQVLTRFGRPDWPKVFRDLQATHSKERKIGVFYSGPNTLAAVLRRLSNQYSTRGNMFKFTKESFGYW